MNKKTILFAVLFSLASTVVHQTSFGLDFEAAAGYWGQTPSGDLAYSPVSSADKLDIRKDLKYDRQYRPFARAKIELPLILPNIYLMATPMKFEETGTKDMTFTFGDIIIDGSQPFDTTLKLDHYDVALYYPISPLKIATLGKFNVEIGINARVIDLDAEVSGSEPVSGASVSESKKLTIVMPMIYAGIQLRPFDKFAIEAEGRGITYSSNHYYDLIGRVKVKPLWLIFVAGGYRHEDIKIDASDVEASVKFSGPFAEAGIEF